LVFHRPPIQSKLKFPRSSIHSRLLFPKQTEQAVPSIQSRLVFPSLQQGEGVREVAKESEQATVKEPTIPAEDEQMA
jgi:hypothetical protein